MRLLHIIGSVDPKTGGPIEGILQQSRDRIGRGWEMEIVSMDAPDAPFMQQFKMRVHGMGPAGGWPSGWRRRLPWNHYRVAPQMSKWIEANMHRFDLAVVHGLWNYSAFAAKTAFARRSAPYVVFTHGMLDPWFKRHYPLKGLAKQLSWWLCEGPLLNGARAVLFTTEEERVVSRNAFFPYRLTERVVRYGIGDIPAPQAGQDQAFLDKVPGVAGQRYLLYLSRIHEKKGCDLLLQAFERIAASQPDLHLVMAGPDRHNLRGRIEPLISDPAVRARVHWPGMLEGDAKWGAYRGAEAFTLISHQENFGIVVAEALAAGLVPLISNKVNIWREIEETGSGLVVPDTVAGAIDALQRFYALSPVQRADMAARARATFLSMFEVGVTQITVDQAFKEGAAS